MPPEFFWYSSSQEAPTFKRRFRRCLQLLRNPRDAWLMLRVVSWALVLPVLKRVVPLKKLAAVMWCHSKTRLNEEQKVATIVRWIYRFLSPADRSCLQRSLILYRFLSKNNFDPLLITGMRKTPDQQWKGHAWVLVDRQPFEESFHSIQDYQPMIIFGRNGVMKQADSNGPGQKERTINREKI